VNPLSRFREEGTSRPGRHDDRDGQGCPARRDGERGFWDYMNQSALWLPWPSKLLRS
jgi:hypothetical protein